MSAAAERGAGRGLQIPQSGLAPGLCRQGYDIGKVLEQQRGRGMYSEVNLTILKDENATRINILKALTALKQNTTAADIAVVYCRAMAFRRKGEHSSLRWIATWGCLQRPR